MPAIIQTVTALRRASRNWRKKGSRIAIVPTMGALHAGHLSLAELAKTQADKVIVSIFVNPTQFAPHEDFDRYPRMLERDMDALGDRVDVVFAPDAAEMYPPDSVTKLEVAGPSLGLETDFRPHFFSGVATIVAKLLIASEADVAIFGEKDYQQLLVVKQLAHDLLIPCEILGAPILRENDGLAMSSRNAYLLPGERRVAGRLNLVLKHAIDQLHSGTAVAVVEQNTAQALLSAGFHSVDYIAVRDAATLQPVTSLEQPARILGAAKIGTTRLIDNMPV